MNSPVRLSAESRILLAISGFARIMRSVRWLGRVGHQGTLGSFDLSAYGTPSNEFRLGDALAIVRILLEASPRKGERIQAWGGVKP